MSKIKEESNFYTEFTGTFRIVDECDGEKVRNEVLTDVFSGFGKAYSKTQV